MNVSRPLLRATRAYAHVHVPRTSPALRLQSRPNAFSRDFTTSRARFAEGPLESARDLPRNKKRLLAFKVAKLGGFLIGSSVIGMFTFLGVVLVHDAFTYTTKHIERVPVSPLALHPSLGGPKNLPIARVLIDDDEVRFGVERPFAGLDSDVVLNYSLP